MRIRRQICILWLSIALIVGACGGVAEKPPTLTKPVASNTPEKQESPIPPTLTPEPTPTGGGGKIIFLSNRYGANTEEIIITDADHIANWTNLTMSGDRKSNLTVSPNGKFVAYKSGLFPEAESIVVLNLEDPASEPFTISPPGDRADNQVWSPDGTRLAFEYTPHGSLVPQIIVLTPGSAEFVTISDMISVNSEPTWSGDGKSIYYIARPSEGGGYYGKPQLIRAAADGNSREVILESDNVMIENPVTNIGLNGYAFWGRAFTIGEYGNLYLSLSGERPAPVLSAVKELNQAYESEFWHAAFSPDSSRLAFAYVDAIDSVEPIKQGVLYLMNLTGSGLKRVGELGEGRFTAPSWSPDGNRFVYSSGGPNSHILIYDAVTSQTIQLTDESFSNSFAPQWIKDVTQINTQTLPDERMEISMPSISTQGLTGRLVFVQDDELRLLDFNKNKAYLISNMPGQKKELTWSSDGRMLAFVNSFSGKEEVYLVEPDKATRFSNLPNNMTKEFTSARQPSFSPDGKWLAFSAGNGDGVYHIYLLELATGNLQALTSGSVVDEWPRWNSASDTLSFSRQGLQIFLGAPYLEPKELFLLSLANGDIQPLASADIENKDSAIWYEKQQSYLYLTKYNGQIIVQMMIDPKTNNSTAVSAEIGPADFPTWYPVISPKGDFIAAQVCDYVDASNSCKGYLYIGYPLFDPFFFSELIGEFSGNTIGNVSAPAWSPDGKFVVATHVESKLVIVSMTSKKVVDFIQGNVHSPAWAP